jgi:hypothetical protein
MSARLILNALVIGALNLASFVIGFWIFSLGGSGEQMLIQGSVAFFVAVLLVVSWLMVFRRVNRLEVEHDFIRVFLLVFVCTPVIFVPVHFVMTGYLTGFGNLIAIATFQFPMNLVAMAVAAALIRKKEKAPRGALSSET